MLPASLNAALESYFILFIFVVLELNPGPVYARQAFYHLSHNPSSLVCVLFSQDRVLLTFYLGWPIICDLPASTFPGAEIIGVYLHVQLSESFSWWCSKVNTYHPYPENSI
jgi:hypothetical protein